LEKLSVDEKTVFGIVKAGDSIDAAELIELAKEAGVDRPLPVVKSLIDLEVIEVCDKRFLRAC
jgi:hypothetical protein